MEKTSKDNTYKFALARFLLDYSLNHVETNVSFDIIAKYFLEYYWNIQTKFKLKQNPQLNKKPNIISIIEKNFPNSFYPHTFAEILDRPEYQNKIQNCIQEIKLQCFDQVISRFQRVKYGKNTVEKKIFYDYQIRGVSTRKRVFPDLNAGIVINPEAVFFFKNNYSTLKNSVILQWTKFLEPLNYGVPLLIRKIEGDIAKRKSLTKYRKILEKFFKNCTYCKTPLEKGKNTHVDHVIPFDYIGEDQLWNLTLACSKCNCSKLGSLPSEKILKLIIQRNKELRLQIPLLDRSLSDLGNNDDNVEKKIFEHYHNAYLLGFMILNRIPND